MATFYRYPTNRGDIWNRKPPVGIVINRLVYRSKIRLFNTCFFFLLVFQRQSSKNLRVGSKFSKKCLCAALLTDGPGASASRWIIFNIITNITAKKEKKNLYNILLFERFVTRVSVSKRKIISSNTGNNPFLITTGTSLCVHSSIIEMYSIK